LSKANDYDATRSPVQKPQTVSKKARATSGKWSIDGDELVQSDESGVGFILFGAQDLCNYDVTLEGKYDFDRGRYPSGFERWNRPGFALIVDRGASGLDCGFVGDVTGRGWTGGNYETGRGQIRSSDPRVGMFSSWRCGALK
jgi:hypothetical protein